MKFRLVCLVAASAMAGFSAHAQSGPMDTCRSQAACDQASDTLIEQSRSVLKTGRYREAAQAIYPAVLSRKTSPLAKARAATAFSDILVEAKLYEYAAGQIERANSATRAPSSEDLLKHARLLAQTDDEDAMLAAYGQVETLATASANLPMIDKLIADYGRVGQTARSGALRAQRSEIATRAQEACALANCRSAVVVDAAVVEYGPFEYPSGARRQSGECTVTFNITEDARPVDLMPDCTDPVFMESAMIAVQESKLTPRYENGVPGPRYNIVVPFAFSPR